MSGLDGIVIWLWSRLGQDLLTLMPSSVEAVACATHADQIAGR
jgi:hypothetical protein